MPRHSDPRSQALTGLLGLGSQSARKSYYPELLARLEELEEERNRYKWLFESAVYGIFQADLDRGLLAANSFMASMLGHASPQALIDGLATSNAAGTATSALARWDRMLTNGSSVVGAAPLTASSDCLNASGEDNSPDFFWQAAAKRTSAGWQLEIAIERDQLGALLWAQAADGRDWVYGCQRDDWTLGPDSRIVEPVALLEPKQRQQLERLLREAICWPAPLVSASGRVTSTTVVRVASLNARSAALKRVSCILSPECGPRQEAPRSLPARKPVQALGRLSRRRVWPVGAVSKTTWS